MSLYCKGKDCKRHLDCMRFARYEWFRKTYHTDSAPGLWFVNEEECVKNNHKDMV